MLGEINELIHKTHPLIIEYTYLTKQSNMDEMMDHNLPTSNLHHLQQVV